MHATLSGQGLAPPPLPSKLAALLLLWRSGPDCQRSALAAWRDAEDRFIAWVEAHPNPSVRWRRKAAQLRAMHRSECGLTTGESAAA